MLAVVISTVQSRPRRMLRARTGRTVSTSTLYGGTRAVLAAKNMDDGSWGLRRASVSQSRHTRDAPDVHLADQLGAGGGGGLLLVLELGLLPVLLEAAVILADDPLDLRQRA